MKIRVLMLTICLCPSAFAAIEMSKEEVLTFLKKFEAQPKAIRIYERQPLVFLEANDEGEKKEIQLKYSENFLETVESFCSNADSLALAPADSTSKDKEIVCWAKLSKAEGSDVVVAAPKAEEKPQEQLEVP